MPRLMGHEASGVVVAVGERVTDVKAGQRVVGDFIVKCDICPACRSGRSNRCQHPRFPNGAYEDYAVLPRQNIHPIEKPGTSYRAAAFMEPLACVVRGQKMLRLAPDETEVIVGAGPIGLSALMTGKMHVPSMTIMIDRDPSRLELARELGADHVIDPTKADAKESVKRLASLGVDVAIEAVGIPETFELCAELVRPGGHIANIGVHGKPVTLHLETLWIKNLTITTQLVDGYSIPLLLEMIEMGKLDPKPLATHTFTFDQYPDAYETFSHAADTHACKVVIKKAA
jgi:alcohol dehydrogenase